MWLIYRLFLERRRNGGKKGDFEEQKKEILVSIMNEVDCNSNENCSNCDEARKNARDAALQSWKDARAKACLASENARDAALQSWKNAREAAINSYKKELNGGLRTGSMSGRC
jgi:hypothetical protein